ncbi:hypothetical protein PUNSTDRAFT_133814 [Punctularia strigosozonata HHB-11173 SS5]|uniref:uncharacterized protein n=1 Tax=Punctularia strigosozonata (strain HHB-11173) TaxID=741275 RepID=UPI000441704B|nr:uncharacterized protein PUNSTDRAFT_133814 [Punctularia strigosozonata HHB-11173 SS5]EIN10047.1 hypothetical protein PUNSTDRAFT_133814 [Punctularia strigosozonata HHB-11173 SS5]
MYFSVINTVTAVCLAQVASAAFWQEFSGAGCSGAPFFNGGSCGGPQQCVTLGGESVAIQTSFGVPCSVPFFNDTTCGTSGGSIIDRFGAGCIDFSDLPSGTGSFLFACST